MLVCLCVCVCVYANPPPPAILVVLKVSTFTLKFYDHYMNFADFIGPIVTLSNQ